MVRGQTRNQDAAGSGIARPRLVHAADDDDDHLGAASTKPGTKTHTQPPPGLI